MPVHARAEVDDDPLGVAGGHGVDGGLHRLVLLVRSNEQRPLRFDLLGEEGPVHDVIAFLGELRLGERSAGRRREHHREHRRSGEQEGEEARPSHSRFSRVRFCNNSLASF